MKSEINCRIVLQKPPAEVDYALQMGHANKYEVIQRQRATGEDLRFEFTINSKHGKNSSIDFSGSFVQGPSGARFIYINIGINAGQIGTHWNRRLKVPLIGITQFRIDKILSINGTLETTVPGTGKDGRPNCATVKPFHGWSIVKK